MQPKTAPKSCLVSQWQRHLPGCLIFRCALENAMTRAKQFTAGARFDRKKSYFQPGIVKNIGLLVTPSIAQLARRHSPKMIREIGCSGIEAELPQRADVVQRKTTFAPRNTASFCDYFEEQPDLQNERFCRKIFEMQRVLISFEEGTSNSPAENLEFVDVSDRFRFEDTTDLMRGKQQSVAWRFCCLVSAQNETCAR